MDVDPTHPKETSGRGVVLTCGALFVIVLAITFVSAVLVPRSVERRRAVDRVECGALLTKIGHGVRTYAEENGAFPHASSVDELDGDPSTSDTPRVWRKLLTLGYLDSPQDLLCPSTPRYSTTKIERAAQSAWLTTLDATGPAPSLEECEELSYGWTRRALSKTERGRTLLCADKAVFGRRDDTEGMRGNHVDGWNVLRVDGSVSWLSVKDEPFPGPSLWGTADPKTDGFLSVKVQADASLLR